MTQFKPFEVEVQTLGRGSDRHYACRPIGQIGTCGNYPFLWSVCLGTTPERAEAKFRAVYSKQIANYGKTNG